MRSSRRRVAWFLGVGAACAVALVLAALLIAWSGMFNVAASRGHWKIVEWMLMLVMRNSVEKRALTIAAPPLDDADLVRLGAAHFNGGCAPCHGAPGIALNPVVLGMLPPPPDLAIVSKEWKAEELFWIVKHGIKYTGMPAWASQQRDDEVWALIAFVRQLPALDEVAYRALALGTAAVAPRTGRQIAIAETAGACARCHGADERGPSSNLVPILHGQPAEFLLHALQAYAAGKRASGIMQPVAADLMSDLMPLVANYYAGLAPPKSARRRELDASAIANGRALASDGAPSEQIPPCLACHGENALNIYPRLAGQHAAYMAGQLRLWKGGLVPDTETAMIMAPIARRLNERQIQEVSAYFESLGFSTTGGSDP
jgi:cytochrome c553